MEFSPESYHSWVMYMGKETSLQEIDWARCIFELAIAQPTLDKPENLWNTYIDFKSNNNRARDLFEKLLEQMKHVKVWISYMMCKTSADLLKNGVHESNCKQMQCIQPAQRVFERAVDYFRTSTPKLKEDRQVILIPCALSSHEKSRRDV
ncbi:Crooked neck-like protein 1 [Camellia lanceoleosa]|uniref:Crooked neck-like protein 1 n=1 Tax=Camellia lanceoleosa TaxID=1840588 RepID=A0ACC0GDP1_9ERIC|nr:Crooked neck-like protein 1 [Camellia lanceoleosa]